MTAMKLEDIFVNAFEGGVFLKYRTHSKEKTHANGTAIKNNHSSMGRRNHRGVNV